MKDKKFKENVKMLEETDSLRKRRIEYLKKRVDLIDLEVELSTKYSDRLQKINLQAYNLDKSYKDILTGV